MVVSGSKWQNVEQSVQKCALRDVPCASVVALWRAVCLVCFVPRNLHYGAVVLSHTVVQWCSSNFVFRTFWLLPHFFGRRVPLTYSRAIQCLIEFGLV